ncbi:hypothetical protein BC829DRAFT_10019 [Chytridium lagenaria]|nr:hypothetical protein BC829DRAFT_10019 [Chytridium lagenaria]
MQDEPDKESTPYQKSLAKYTYLFETLSITSYPSPPLTTLLSLPSTFTVDPLPSAPWSSILSLQSHLQDWSAEMHQDWKKTRKFAEKMLEEMGVGDEDVGGVMELVSRIESNGFGVWAKGKESCVGRAVYPEASFFNHSCDPSCECVQVQGILTVKTRRAVKKGI